MIVLDTNVLSELMRESASEVVLDWMASQLSTRLFTTAISESEIFYGLAVLPRGKRRKEIEEAAAGLFADFEGRVLSFDSAAARTYGELAAERRRRGRPISQADAQIAAIVRSRGGALATRNGGDFADCGLTLVDPWSIHDSQAGGGR